MEGEKLKLLEGMDSYLPHVDGVINCMNNYCLNAYKKIDVLAIAPRYKNYKDTCPYEIKRYKSFYFPILDIQYGQATKDKKFFKEIMSRKYDIVHCNSPFNMAKFMLKVAKAQNIPAVITFHSNMRPIFRSIVKSKFIAEKMVQSLGKIYNQYTEVFVCSPLVAEQCRSFGYTGKISYLPFGTNISKCEDKSEYIQQANKEFGLNDDDIMFLYIGRMEKLKRVDFILKSLKILKDKGIKFKFYAVGKGSDMKKLQKLKQKLGFDDNEIIFTGFVDSKLFPLLYSRANLFLFPSLYDNFGLVKVEAAAFDTPGLFIENSCAGYGVENGVNGFLSKDTVEDFANTIQIALQDRQKLKEIGKNAGRDLYISWEHCTDQFIQRLDEIVRRYKDENKK